MKYVTMGRSCRQSIRSIALGAAMLWFAQPAQAKEDTQAWGSVVATGTVRGGVFLWLEAQARFTDEIGGGSQILIRPAIGKKIGRDAHIVAGYAYVRSDPAGGALTHEHRPWQQVQFVPMRLADGSPLVISRTRLEQRMVEDREGVSWRLRQFIKVQLPLADAGALKAVAYTEGFFNLNATRWGARDGTDQIRSFVGVGFPVAHNARLEPGYLNQHVFRRGEDRTNHILSATLFVGL